MKTKTAFIALALTLAVPLFLGACGGNTKAKVQDTLGLTKEAPDEFRVVRRAPLEMPEEFSLPKPTPGKARPQEAAPRDRAKAILTGAPLQPTAERSTSEKALLMEAGAMNTDKNIRSLVDSETEQMVGEKTSVIERLGIREPRGAKGEVIDPMSEAERLKQEGVAERVIKPILPVADENEEDEQNDSSTESQTERKTEE